MQHRLRCPKYYYVLLILLSHEKVQLSFQHLVLLLFFFQYFFLHLKKLRDMLKHNKCIRYYLIQNSKYFRGHQNVIKTNKQTHHKINSIIHLNLFIEYINIKHIDNEISTRSYLKLLSQKIFKE